jgi:hypothetical protein
MPYAPLRNYLLGLKLVFIYIFLSSIICVFLVNYLLIHKKMLNLIHWHYYFRISAEPYSQYSRGG